MCLHYVATSPFLHENGGIEQNSEAISSVIDESVPGRGK